MPRHLVRPYGFSISPTRTVSLIMLLAVLWVLYDLFRDPASWRWLAPEAAADSLPVSGEEPPAAPSETVVPGPNDLDETAAGELRTKLLAVTDRTPLRPRDMPAYWQLMEWSRAQPIRELERRAQPEPAFSQIWERPEDYRGRLIRLRLHVRRVLRYAAPENASGVSDVYEAWGWTDDSRSFPYVVVFPERPAGLPIGPDVRSEVVFTGYFLKVMGYTAFDVNRGAPLLVGRVRLVKPVMAKPAPALPPTQLTQLRVPFGILAGSGLIGWLWLSRRRPQPASVLPERLEFDALTADTAADLRPDQELQAIAEVNGDVALANAQPSPISPDRERT